MKSFKDIRSQTEKKKKDKDKVTMSAKTIASSKGNDKDTEVETQVQELTKENVKTADRKPEVYTKPDGKKGVRMVPMDKEIIKNEDAFKPHMMYDPKTGKAYKANKPEDHDRMSKMGYTHEKPDVKEAVKEMHCKDCGCQRGNINPKCDCPNDGSAPITAKHWVEQTSESVNEISQKTKDSYISRASGQATVGAVASKHLKGDEKAKNDKMVKKRQAGIKLATEMDYNPAKGGYNQPKGKEVGKKVGTREAMDYNPAQGGYNQPKGKPPVGKRVGTREAMKPEVKKALAKSSAASEKGKKAVTLPKAPFKMEGAMKRLSTGDGMDTFKKKPAGKPMYSAPGARGPEHKAAVKKYVSGMKSNRPASKPTSEMSDMEKTRQMATTGDKPKPKTSTNKKPPSEMMPEAKDPAIDRLKILVRQGMMDKKDLPKIVRSLEKVKAGKEVAPADRKILFSLMGELLGMITGDEQMFQKARKKVREDAEPVNELVQLAPAAMAVGNAAVRMAPAAGAAVQTVKKAVKKVMGKEGKAYGPTGVSYSDEPNLQVKSVGDGIKKGKTIKGTIQPPKKVGMKKKPFDAPVPMNPAKNEAMGARMHRMKMVDRINKSLAKQRNNPDEKDRDIQKINKSLEKQRQQKS